MDEATRAYRQGQLELVQPDGVYNATLQIRAGTGAGKTKHLSITNDELVLIKAFLTNGEGGE